MSVIASSQRRFNDRFPINGQCLAAAVQTGSILPMRYWFQRWRNGHRAANNTPKFLRATQSTVAYTDRASNRLPTHLAVGLFPRQPVADRPLTAVALHP